LVAVVVIGSIAAIAMNTRTRLLYRVPMDKPRDVLIERARQFVKKAGYTEKAADSVFSFDFDPDIVQYLQERDKTSSRWKMLQAVNPVFFWYRQSPRPLEHLNISGLVPVTPSDPPMQFSGDTVVRMDTDGQLRGFQMIPLQEDSSAGPPITPDWTLLFLEAGLDPSRWMPAEPRRLPLYYADSRAAWQGTLPDAPDIPVRIEAAAYRGKPVSFEIVGPWTRAERMVDAAPAPNQTLLTGVFFLALGGSMIGGLFFARKNLRLGRGDRRGATRLASFVLCSWMIGWIFHEHHVATIWETYFVLFGGLGWGLFVSTLIWVLYIALEPFVRRRWPQVLVSWTRVLSGEFTDPLVGRDVLVGCAAGVGWRVFLQLAVLAPAWFGYPVSLNFDNGLRELAQPGLLVGQTANGLVKQQTALMHLR
jgi:hypothetical protein